MKLQQDFTVIPMMIICTPSITKKRKIREYRETDNISKKRKLTDHELEKPSVRRKMIYSYSCAENIVLSSNLVVMVLHNFYLLIIIVIIFIIFCLDSIH